MNIITLIYVVVPCIILLIFIFLFHVQIGYAWMSQLTTLYWARIVEKMKRKERKYCRSLSYSYHIVPILNIIINLNEKKNEKKKRSGYIYVKYVCISMWCTFELFRQHVDFNVNLRAICSHKMINRLIITTRT